MKSKCKCKETFTFGMNGPTYDGGKWYDYEIKKHNETNIDVYYVQADYEVYPMLNVKFHEYFEDLNKIREDKINIILNGSEVQE